MKRASVHAINDAEFEYDGTEDDQEVEAPVPEEYDASAADRDKWRQGLKTPNVRTIKVFKSPSEKQYLTVRRIRYHFFYSSYIVGNIAQPSVQQGP